MCYWGYAVGERPWLASGVVAGPDDLDLDSLVAGVVPESCILEDEPVFLVCTHAKRNACCARIGLPLARSLAEFLPDRVWETSHVGGDRYAANLVCLPHGIFYGSMSQAAAIAAADAYRSGEIILDRFRGRAGIPEPLQAVEHFARTHTGECSVGAVAVESSRSDGDVTEAIVRCGDVRFQVVVEPSAFTSAVWHGLRREDHHLPAGFAGQAHPCAVRHGCPQPDQGNITAWPCVGTVTP